MFDLSSNYCFHLRLTCEKDTSRELITLFTKKFKPVKFVICHEVSESGVAHSHSHIEGDEAFAKYHESKAGKTARSAFFEKHDMKGLYNFTKLTKTPRQNICYVVKGNNYIATKGITDDEIEELKQWTEEIEKSKKMEQRDKLLALYREEFKHIPRMKKEKNCLDEEYEVVNDERPHRLYEIAQWIHWTYIDDFNKPPPTVHMREYVLWIASKECGMDTKAYYFNMFPIA